MPDNRIISRNKYVVNSVTSATTDNSLTKRPYTRTPVSPSKRHSDSDSFDDTLHSTTSHNPSNDGSDTFPNELDNMLRLKSEENSRLVQSRFNQNNSNASKSNESIIETELHNKLSQAMGIKVDTSTLYKKVELLNSLKEESDN